MILIGQYDSPFVRRVAIGLDLYGIPYDHRPWSAFSDAEKIAEFNPLCRVPTLVLDDDRSIVETTFILDFLDSLAATNKRLIPESGSPRQSALKTCSLASGLCDKMVSLVYERVFHAVPSEVWTNRCSDQIVSVLASLEMECTALDTPYWLGGSPGHADVAVACAVRFLSEAHPKIFEGGHWPCLQNHSARCEELESFKRKTQVFIPPKG